MRRVIIRRALIATTVWLAMIVTTMYFDDWKQLGHAVKAVKHAWNAAMGTESNGATVAKGD